MKSAANKAEFKRPSVSDLLRTEAGRREFEEMFAWLRRRGVSKRLLERARDLLEFDTGPMHYPTLALEILETIEEVSRDIHPKRLCLVGGVTW